MKMKKLPSEANCGRATDRWLKSQGVPDMNATAAMAAFSKTAKHCRMDAAKRSQSRMDCSILRAKSPSLIGTALYGAVRRNAKQVAATSQTA